MLWGRCLQDIQGTHVMCFVMLRMAIIDLSVIFIVVSDELLSKGTTTNGETRKKTNKVMKLPRFFVREGKIDF